MAQSDEDSVSPGALSPVYESPSHTIADVSASRLSNLKNEFNSQSLSTLETSIAEDEPVDYLNNGIAHQDHSPHILNKLPSSTPLRQSNLKNTSVPANGFPFENTNGSTTPPGRRSVQFSRGGEPEIIGHTRQDSWGEDGDTPLKDRRSGQRLMSKLKSLASTSSLQTHSRSQSNPAIYTEEGTGTGSGPHTPQLDRSARFPEILQEEESDADAEETADEAPAPVNQPKKKRRLRRLAQVASGSQTAPNTPKIKHSFGPDSPGGPSRPMFSESSRRATDGSLMEQRGHHSEGEARERLGSNNAWRRGSYWKTNGRLGAGQTSEAEGTPASRRPINFRRAFTGVPGGQSDGDGVTTRRPFPTERASTSAHQKWRTIKNAVKLITRKDEPKQPEYIKSTELMAELRAGAPAALMLASMIQRDEHGNRRIPVLLEQLKVRVVDSKPIDDDPTETAEAEKHPSFRIELEYGSGLNRMKWVIHRTLRDFANLHLRYKFQGRNEKYLQLRGDASSRPKQPHFPTKAFPTYLTLRSLGIGDSSEEEEEEANRGDETVGEGTNSEPERPKKSRRRPSFAGSRRKSSAVHDGGLFGIGAQEKKAERSRKRLEQYIQQMIHWLIFRADSNRLCRFLELSALGVRLAAEGGYHGKEGFMVIQSAKGMDVRRMLTPQLIFQRHSPKWFLVRHSYVVCVDSPETMNIYDVYLADSNFEIQRKRRKFKELGGKEILQSTKTSVKNPQHHTLKLQNSERKVKLIAKNERQLRQFEDSITFMLHNTLWSSQNRFDSFAPVRTDCFAQWLVDGRDYMWNVSRAISMAKDVIYIHDWWLSPQLYLRRPAAISQKWRLDRLLKRKAEEGVKVFIIVYRNVEAAIPIDSEYTKSSMLDLHPNVFVQRSPNQYKLNQFFFAHHEKICIVDHMIAFVGGIDLCFGRWDSPDHSVTDDKPTGFEETDLQRDVDHCQMWPGKDYSNPRVQDFFKLNEPFAEMYDRSKTPRMPWHDISMQVVGQPARDLTRHFVQRWNYILRGRTPSRPTPFLLPPPDYQPSELEELGITGTCEVQILRSACSWSLGTDHTEHSIMNAYCKMIEESEHFVYMENQFFITSCETMDIRIVNKIGDAIVERALRAHANDESWRCCILIPLMPGFQNTVDEADGTSVRLIMQCQFRSICRGEGSIFGRLRAAGIAPEDYIDFFSLRAWGRIGPRKTLVTEQLYIHAKVIIVDDRIALIGSANINERSMLGNRDSETAAVVRDRDMIHSTMDGRPYQVGRFAHTLRMRLMREHLGLDTDEIMEEERRAELDREQEDDYEKKMNSVYDPPDDTMVNAAEHSDENHDSFTAELKEKRKDAAAIEVGLARDSIIIGGGREVLVSAHASEGKGTVTSPRPPHKPVVPSIRPDGADEGPGNDAIPPMPEFPRRTTEQLGLSQLSQLPSLPSLDDTDIGGPSVVLDNTGKPKPFNSLTADLAMINIDRNCMRDPLNDTFFEDTWRKVADKNTKIFRKVFRCNPDNEVTNWEEYREYAAYNLRVAEAQGGKGAERAEDPGGKPTGPPGAQALSPISEKIMSLNGESHPMGTVSDWAAEANAEHDRRTDTSNINLATVDQSFDGLNEKPLPQTPADREKKTSHEKPRVSDSNPLGIDLEKTPRKNTVSTNGGPPSSASNQGSTKRRRRGTTRGTNMPFAASDDLPTQEECDDMLGYVQGHLVVFPYDWLVKEEANSNWLFPVDQVAPLQIYN